MLQPLFVLQSPDWRQRAELEQLDQPRRARLIEDVEDVLYLWAVAIDGQLDRATSAAQRAELAECGRAICGVLRRTGAGGPAEALDRRLALRGSGQAAPREAAPGASTTDLPADVCFRWGIYCARNQETANAIAWLDRATRAKPEHFWSQYLLSQQYQTRVAENPEAMERALAHISMAIALRPRDPRTRFERAALHRDRGAWARSAEDLRVALEHDRGTDTLRIRLNLGLAYQALGRDAEAIAEFDRVIAEGDQGDPLRRAARVNRAQLLADAGDMARAGTIYDELLQLDSTDAVARLGRAQLAMRQGHLDAADADLTALLGGSPEDPVLWSQRALVRLAARRLTEAEADIERAIQLGSTSSRQRARTRIWLALGRVSSLRLADLDLAELRRLPVSGPTLESDMEDCVEGLRTEVDRGAGDACLVSGLFLAALGRHPEALDVANRGVAAAPRSVRALLVRARVRQAGGDSDGALRDLDEALALEPGEPRVLWLRGLLHREAGDLSAARTDLEDAAQQVTSSALQCDLAETLMALDEGRRAIDAFSRGYELDPEDPEVYLGRGLALLRLRQPDMAIVDLERAVEWSGDRTDLLLRITKAYSGCLQSRPDRTSRVLRLAWRAVGSVVRPGDAP